MPQYRYNKEKDYIEISYDDKNWTYSAHTYAKHDGTLAYYENSNHPALSAIVEMLIHNNVNIGINLEPK